MNSCVLCDSLLDEKLTFCDLLTLTKPKARACDTCFEKFQRISGSIARSVIVTGQVKSAWIAKCG